MIVKEHQQAETEYEQAVIIVLTKRMTDSYFCEWDVSDIFTGFDKTHPLIH